MFEQKHPYASIFTIAIILGMVFWFVGGSRIKDLAPYYVKWLLGDTARVSIKNITVQTEVARSSHDREKGLSGRDYLPIDKGMLFLFPAAGQYAFTMAKTELPLDIIWMNEGKIVYIAANAAPGRALIDPGVAADQALEIRGGQAGAYNWRVGDQAAIVIVRSPIHF
jgi:uncharacterized membrane protein (UPF0127 family)